MDNVAMAPGLIEKDAGTPDMRKSFPFAPVVVDEVTVTTSPPTFVNVRLCVGDRLPTRWSPKETLVRLDVSLRSLPPPVTGLDGFPALELKVYVVAGFAEPRVLGEKVTAKVVVLPCFTENAPWDCGVKSTEPDRWIEETCNGSAPD